jgi:hypothetical protein
MLVGRLVRFAAFLNLHYDKTSKTTVHAPIQKKCGRCPVKRLVLCGANLTRFLEKRMKEICEG